MSHGATGGIRMSEIKKRQEEDLNALGGEDASNDASKIYASALESNGQAGGGATQAANSGSNAASPSSRSDYDDLRDQNYKNLLDTQIQLEAARQSALKASRSQLAAQGLYGTGYGSTAQTGISNAYINAMQSASSSYNDTDVDISKSEREAAKTDASSRFTSLPHCWAMRPHRTILTRSLRNTA